MDFSWTENQKVSKPAASKARSTDASLGTRSWWPGKAREINSGTEVWVEPAPASMSQKTTDGAGGAVTRGRPPQPGMRSLRTLSPITST